MQVAEKAGVAAESSESVESTKMAESRGPEEIPREAEEVTVASKIGTAVLLQVISNKRINSHQEEG